MHGTTIRRSCLFENPREICPRIAFESLSLALAASLPACFLSSSPSPSATPPPSPRTSPVPSPTPRIDRTIPWNWVSRLLVYSYVRVQGQGTFCQFSLTSEGAPVGDEAAAAVSVSKSRVGVHIDLCSCE